MNKTVLWTYLFNGYNIIITIADVATDLLVMKEYYEQDNMRIFLWIGLINLLITQLSYCIEFISRYVNGCTILIFFILLPISPFLPFIFYWASIPNNCLSRLFLICGLKINEYHISEEARRRKLGGKDITIKEWIDKTYHQNKGFILEGMVESFPQILLQISAILYNKRITWLTIISLFLSLMSFSIKSIVFSKSITPLIFIYNWLSVICDLFGMFAIAAWIFFVPDSSDYYIEINQVGRFTPIAIFWFIKMFCLSCPLLLLVSFIIAFDISCRSYFRKVRTWWTKCKRRRNILLHCIYFIVSFCCFSGIGIFIIEIPFFSGIAYIVYEMIDQRFGEKYAEMADNIISFVEEGYETNNFCFKCCLFSNSICCCRHSISYPCCAIVSKKLIDPNIHNKFVNGSSAFFYVEGKYPDLPPKEILISRHPEFSTDLWMNRQLHGMTLRISIANLLLSGIRISKDYKLHCFLMDSIFNQEQVNMMDIQLANQYRKYNYYESTNFQRIVEKRLGEKNDNMDKVIPFQSLTLAHLRYFSQQSKFSTVLSMLNNFYFIMEDRKKYLREAIRRSKQEEILYAKIQLKTTQIVTYFLLPCYIVGRILVLFFPWTCLIYNWITLGSISRIDTLQLILTAIYTLLVFILFVIAIQVFWRFWILWHILPGAKIDADSVTNHQKTVVSDMRKLYNGTQSSAVQKLLKEKFGTDIANILVEYLAYELDINRLNWYRGPPIYGYYSANPPQENNALILDL